MGLSIIVPAYNEEECIEECLKQIRQIFRGRDYEVIVVNDGSTDRTHRIMTGLQRRYPAIRYLFYQPNRGYSFAVRTGFAAASKEYVSFLDADLQYRPDDLLKMYEYARKHQSRFLIGQPRNKYYSPFRRLQSKIYNKYISLLFGLKIKDANSLKLMEKRYLDNINFTLKYGMIELETLIGFKLQNCRIQKIPITVRDRFAGRSKCGLKVILRTVCDAIVLRFQQKRLLKTQAAALTIAPPEITVDNLLAVEEETEEAQGFV